MTRLAQKLPLLLLVLILLVSTLIHVFLSYTEPAVGDEVVHTTASYSYAKYFDGRLNPEHPPLVKFLSGIPLTFLPLSFPRESTAWQGGTNDQYSVGQQFFFEEGNDADTLILWARIGPILLTLVLTFFLFFWSRKLFGDWWALLPTFLFAFSPTVLAHGHYVTTDIGAALGIALSLYFFLIASRNPSRKNILVAGLAFGFAQLLKFSAFLLIPYFIFLSFLFFITQVKKERDLLRTTKSLLSLFVIGYLLVYVFYIPLVYNYPPEKQRADTTSLLSSLLKGGEETLCHPVACIAELTVWASDKTLLRPYADYSLGLIMAMRRVHGGGPTYFLGELSRAGDWYYFPLVYVMKEPLPVLLLLLFGFLLFLRRSFRIRGKRIDFFHANTTEYALGLFILLYMGVSMRSPLNIGIRHLIPLLPFVYILTTSSIRRGLGEKVLPSTAYVGGLALLLLWFSADVVRAYPHYLPYFNETVGTENGWKYVVDSNYDWGQDIKKLPAFMRERGIEKIAIDFIGPSDPLYYLGDKAVLWSSEKGNPRDAGIEWLALSVETLQSAKATLGPNEKRDVRMEYAWLPHPFEPSAKVGTSLFLYTLDKPLAQQQKFPR